LKVIIVSASTQDKQQTLTAGADDFLFKPLREADLFASIGQHCGVQFVYTEEGAEIGVNKPTTVLVDADSVRQLPVKLLDNLRKAVDNAEFSAIAEYLAQVSQINPELGHRLLQLADRFDYESLLALLNEE
jgi:CheY-like chemotaxis protein